MGDRQRSLLQDDSMCVGHEVRCEACGNKWNRYRHRYSIGPPSDSVYVLRCSECDFTLETPAIVDGSSWRKWLAQNGELTSIDAMAMYCVETMQLIRDSMYKMIRLPEPRMECFGCSKPMEIHFGEEKLRCPVCLESDVLVETEFADSISFNDPADINRWWKRIGI